MDLELAAYKQGKQFPKVFNDSQPIPRRRPLMFQPLMHMHPTDLQKVVTKLRHSSWRRKEAHDKQLQFILNKERYAQNATWQAEHDRLLSQTTALPGLQSQINDRLDTLRNVLLK